MAGNDSLIAARFAKGDEFYTQLSDIERELVHYRDHFQGKVVYCNCDNYKESNFFKYFRRNFVALGLKRLVTSHFGAGEVAYALSLELGGSGKLVASRAVLRGGGDFRSEECVALLERSDIVVSNPPFSLFREYISQLAEHAKQFLIIGNMIAVTYREFFPLIRDNLVWLGVSPRSMYFITPGNELVSVNAVWFTNLSHSHRNKLLPLTSSYCPDQYPTYDNYDAIEVSRVVSIPKDYDGVMGVPITFLSKYNSSQFKLLGSNADTDQDPDGLYGGASYIDGRGTFNRIFIKRIVDGAV